MVSTKEDVVEVEIDGPQNECVVFAPIGTRRLRGRWDWGRIANPHAAVPASRWPSKVIPGQVIGIDRAAGAAWLREPLRERGQERLRDHIEKELGLSVAEEREEFPHPDVVTFEFWLARLVESGHGRVVRGELRSVEEIRKDKPRVSFFPSRVEDPKDKLIEKLTGLLSAALPASQRKELAKLFEDGD